MGQFEVGITACINFSVFSLVYWLVPNLKIHYKSVIPGALFATIGWILTSLGFSYYVGNYGNYSNTYGSIGAIIVLMMWLYFSAIILMLGGQLNAVMTERKLVIVQKKKAMQSFEMTHCFLA